MGNHRTDARRRQEMRKRLLGWGMDPKEVELCIKQMKERQIMKARGELPVDAPLCTRAEYARLVKKNNAPNYEGAGVLQLGKDYEPESDKGFKPTAVDPVLNGVARATGQTAKAVKRRRTMTKAQYDGTY